MRSEIIVLCIKLVVANAALSRKEAPALFLTTRILKIYYHSACCLSKHQFSRSPSSCMPMEKTHSSHYITVKSLYAWRHRLLCGSAMLECRRFSTCCLTNPFAVRFEKEEFRSGKPTRCLLRRKISDLTANFDKSLLLSKANEKGA